MFEPIHGSAPKYKGPQQSQPNCYHLGQGQCSLRVFGEMQAAANGVMNAIQRNLRERKSAKRLTLAAARPHPK